MSSEETQFLHYFIKDKLITKNNGLNTTYKINPTEYLSKRKIPEHIATLIDTPEKLIKYIYDNKIVIPTNPSNICVTCGSKTNFLSLPAGFRIFCSPECFKNSPDKQERINNGFMKAFGVDNCLKLPEIREKCRDSLLKNHGVTNALKLKTNFSISPETAAKISATQRSKTKDEKDEIHNKRRKTSLERYGDENIQNVQAVKDKRKATMNERFGSDYFYGSDAHAQFMQDWSMKNFGVKHYSQRHCKNLNDMNKDFILRSFVKDKRFQIFEMMKYFNVSECFVNQWKRDNNVAIPNKIIKSKNQQYIYDAINVDIVEKLYNTKKVIPPLEIDIYIPSAKLAIEYNGRMHHSRGVSKHEVFNTPDFPIDYHLNKTLKCLEKGVELLHIFDNESKDLWISFINSKLGFNKCVDFDDCDVRKISNIERSEFLTDNHIFGDIESDNCFGVFYNGELIFTLGYSLSNNTTEIKSICHKMNYHTANFVSKVIGQNRDDFVGNIVYYFDRRLGSPEHLLGAEFEIIETLEPECFYFKDDKDEFHRFKSDSNYKSYRQIWDCGKFLIKLNL